MTSVRRATTADEELLAGGRSTALAMVLLSTPALLASVSRPLGSFSHADVGPPGTGRSDPPTPHRRI